MRLMRKCPCPVWAVNSSHGGKYARILAAVDPQPFDEKMNDLDIKIMELATSLARTEGSALYTVNCWRRNRERTFKNLFKIKPAVANDLIKKTRKAHKRQIKKLLEKFSLDYRSSRVHLLEGKPSDLIVDLAKKKKVELVVMGTVARTGIAGFLMGNTAEKVLNRLECSVLAVKPEGFKTPVKLE
jgi:nucleotide-binding universal stress UspA family protein